MKTPMAISAASFKTIAAVISGSRQRCSIKTVLMEKPSISRNRWQSTRKLPRYRNRLTATAGNGPLGQTPKASAPTRSAAPKAANRFPAVLSVSSLVPRMLSSVMVMTELV